MTFLGYSFYKTKEGFIGYKVPKERVDRLRQKIREITNKNWSVAMEERIRKLNQLLRGWTQYYRLTSMQWLVGNLDGWVRRRLRAVRWKEWKKTSTKYKNLVKLGTSPKEAWQHANSRKGYWRIAKSWILNKTLTNQYWKEQGFIGFLDYYLVVKVDT
ncbi:Group II intron, maturase-specific domain [Geosporobacter subterraneus DSM 17957]|uniref:Group II intron, maturase-specific domain n=1 Tax=Geosporobacter subterraneus DSM 17957 TaxID=1121919 RepID=A0A1M6JLP7_9FIRM|nr:group II intron maturase-specific domain-containing protein [Geosporobacter subterraneus]SHJ47596.1 Group II intron, maturase-specific domain [Geosporobacter subterraneus DSM 17957]